MNIKMKSIDTLHIYERLKKAKTSEAQARELAEILRELVDDQLATKNDLEKVKLELEAKIQNSKNELQSEIEKSKHEMRTEIAKSKVSIIIWIIGWITGLILGQTGILMAVR